MVDKFSVMDTEPLQTPGFHVVQHPQEAQSQITVSAER